MKYGSIAGGEQTTVQAAVDIFEMGGFWFIVCWVMMGIVTLSTSN